MPMGGARDGGDRRGSAGLRQERRPRNTGPSITSRRAPTRGGARDGRDRNGSDRIGNVESSRKLVRLCGTQHKIKLLFSTSCIDN